MASRHMCGIFHYLLYRLGEIPYGLPRVKHIFLRLIKSAIGEHRADNSIYLEFGVQMVPFQGYHNNFVVSEGNLQLGNTGAPSPSSFGYKSFLDTFDLY